MAFSVCVTRQWVSEKEKKKRVNGCVAQRQHATMKLPFDRQTDGGTDRQGLGGMANDAEKRETHRIQE